MFLGKVLRRERLEVKVGGSGRIRLTCVGANGGDLPAPVVLPVVRVTWIGLCVERPFSQGSAIQAQRV